MSSPGRHVIIGASLAGARAAETLRDEGYEGEIVLIGDEPSKPYERPPLSKEYLRGELDVAELAVHDETFYRGAGVDLRTGVRATAIDTSRRHVDTDDGNRIRYDKLLLATGSAPRALPVDGADNPRVHQLRTVADADRLRTVLDETSHITVIGAGWIGCEVAASARQKGVEVTLIEPVPVPLRRVLGDKIGQFYADLHRGNGVDTKFGTKPTAIEVRDSEVIVSLDDGTKIESGAVVAGVGASPRTELAESGGITVDNGIQVQASLETSVKGVFAAGDVASAWHPRYRTYLRVEHWANALHQGAYAAKNMLGGVEIFDRLPYFFSDQYDVGMEYTGHGADADAVVVRGELADGEFVAFWLKGRSVIAVMNVNVWDVGDQLKALVNSNGPVDVGRLADTSVALGALVT